MPEEDLDKTVTRPKTISRSPLRDKISMSTVHLTRKSLSVEISIERKAFLEILGLEGGPAGFALNKNEITLGRKSDCDVQLNLDGISRVHARIFFRDEDYYVEDLGSTNGTYVNGIKVIRCVLRNNDRIEIGSAKIIFVEERMRRKSN